MIKSCILHTPIASSYLRNNRSTRQKSLRCFPDCSSRGHVNGGFCGQSLRATVFVNVDQSGSLTADEMNSEPKRILDINDFIIIMEIRPSSIPRISRQSFVKKQEIHNQLRMKHEKSSLEKELFMGEMDIISYDPVSKMMELYVTFNGNHSSWDYSWKSNRWSGPNEKHVVDIIVLKYYSATEFQVCSCYTTNPFIVISSHKRGNGSHPQVLDGKEEGEQAEGEDQEDPDDQKYVEMKMTVEPEAEPAVSVVKPSTTRPMEINNNKVNNHPHQKETETIVTDDPLRTMSPITAASSVISHKKPYRNTNKKIPLTIANLNGIDENNHLLTEPAVDPQSLVFENTARKKRSQNKVKEELPEMTSTAPRPVVSRQSSANTPKEKITHEELNEASQLLSLLHYNPNPVNTSKSAREEAMVEVVEPLLTTSKSLPLFPGMTSSAASLENTAVVDNYFEQMENISSPFQMRIGLTTTAIPDNISSSQFRKKGLYRNHPQIPHKKPLHMIDDSELEDSAHQLLLLSSKGVNNNDSDDQDTMDDSHNTNNNDRGSDSMGDEPDYEELFLQKRKSSQMSTSRSTRFNHHDETVEVTAAVENHSPKKRGRKKKVRTEEADEMIVRISSGLQPTAAAIESATYTSSSKLLPHYKQICLPVQVTKSNPLHPAPVDPKHSELIFPKKVNNSLHLSESLPVQLLNNSSSARVPRTTRNNTMPLRLPTK
jgi:hypothetical protein